jgi:hypothetical protein
MPHSLRRPSVGVLSLLVQLWRPPAKAGLGPNQLAARSSVSRLRISGVTFVDSVAEFLLAFPRQKKHGGLQKAEE